MALAVVALVADVSAKLAARRLLPSGGVELLPGVSLRLFENVHGPFGVGPIWLALAVSTLVLALIVLSLRHLQAPSYQRHASLGLLLGGGLSNLGERVLFGRTTDVLWLASRTALNVADLAVLGGLAVLALSLLRRSPGSRPYHSHKHGNPL